MIRQRKPSSATLKILNCLSHAPDGAHGYALMKETGLASGTLYPILARLVDRGWLDKNWDIGEDQNGPPRRIYTLTALGRAQMKGITVADGLQPQMAKVRNVK